MPGRRAAVPPVIFHVGFPKTATTMLQGAVFARLQHVANIGKPYPPSGPEQHHSDPGALTPLPRAIRHLAVADRQAYDPAAEAAVREGIAAALASGRTVLLSEEILVSVRRNDPVEVARRLHRVWPDARILITLREQRSFLVSHYLDDVKRERQWEHTSSFRRWLEEERSRSLRGIWHMAQYADTVALYAGLFGKDRIHVLLFEDMTSDRLRFAAGLAGALDVPAEEIGGLLAAARPVKKRVSRGRALAHQISATIAPAALRRPLSRALRQLLSFDSAPARPRIPAALSEPLRRFYADGNRQLEAEYGLKLAGYGYAV